MEQLETQLGEIKTALVETSSKMLEAVAQRDEEIKALGNAREETGARIASLDSQVMQIAADVKGVQEAVRTFQAEEQRLLSPFDADVKSIGDIFTTSQAYEEMVASKATYSQPVNLKGFFTKVSHADALTSIDAAGNLLGRTLQRNNILVEGQRPVRLRDLMTVVPTSATNVEFVQQLGFASIRTFVLDTPAPTRRVIAVDNVNGFDAGMQVTINGDTRKIVSAVRDTGLETGVITLDAALRSAPDAGDVMTSLAIGGIAETRYKPSIRMRLEERSASYVTIAALYPVTRQALTDISQLRNVIDMKLVYALELAEEWHILYGDGSAGKQLQGLLTHPSRQVYPWSAGLSGDTKIDAIRRSATLARLAQYPASAVALHPNDWEDIELEKGNDGHYIWVTVTTGGQPQLWRMRVVDTEAIADGTAAVGSFDRGVTLYDLESANIRVGEQHEDFFARNMVAVLAEERIIQTVERPESFVEVQFDGPPA